MIHAPLLIDYAPLALMLAGGGILGGVLAWTWFQPS